MRVVRVAAKVRAAARGIAALWREARTTPPAPDRFRAEAFGGIVEIARPRALVFVDRAMARELGHDGGARWADATADGDLDRVYAAPLEAHLQLTNKCEVGCVGCYTGATPQGAAGELGLDGWKRAIDTLAEMGVFHLALGGGESATLPWLGELAAHARARGVVPNLTTSGLDGLANLLPIAGLFGRINVSMDGVGARYAETRGVDGFERADAAVRALRAVKPEIGLNVVVTRPGWDGLDDVFAYAEARGLEEVELLRFKPSGRGREAYAQLACTDAQHRAFWPRVQELSARHRVRLRVDCSYTPMIAWHGVGPELMRALGVTGCTGGDHLVAARASGTVSACSFARAEAGTKIDALDAYWTTPDAFGAFRTWREAAEPCVSCDVHALCRGGCRVVSAFGGDASAPDPECPKVVDSRPPRVRLTVYPPARP